MHLSTRNEAKSEVIVAGKTQESFSPCPVKNLGLSSTPSGRHLRTLIDRPDVFVADAILTVGVPLGADAFVSAYVAATCQEISADIDKLDPLTDGFVHALLPGNPSPVPQRTLP
jgi:hypothetical protein